MLLALFVLADIFSYSLILSQNRAQDKKIFIQKDSLENFNTKNIHKLSDIKSPCIDEEAVSVEKIAVKEDKACTTLPTKIWTLLFFAYLALLIFNLAYKFNCAVKIQWFWELLYTFLTLAVWCIFDSCRINIWYPVFILKIGILIYAVYLYFFNKKNEI